EAAPGRGVAGERQREAANRRRAITAGSMGLTSLVSIALLGGAGAASGQDVAQAGNEAAAAGVDPCPGDEAGGGSAATDPVPEGCLDPDQADPGGSEPPPEPSPEPEPAPQPEPS